MAKRKKELRITPASRVVRKTLGKAIRRLPLREEEGITPWPTVGEGWKTLPSPEAYRLRTGQRRLPPMPVPPVRTAEERQERMPPPPPPPPPLDVVPSVEDIRRVLRIAPYGGGPEWARLHGITDVGMAPAQAGISTHTREYWEEVGRREQLARRGPELEGRPTREYAPRRAGTISPTEAEAVREREVAREGTAVISETERRDFGLAGIHVPEDETVSADEYITLKRQYREWRYEAGIAQREVQEKAEATGDIQKDEAGEVTARPRELKTAETGTAPKLAIRRVIRMDGESQDERAVRSRTHERIEGLQSGEITPSNDTERAYASFYAKEREKARALAKKNKQDPTAVELEVILKLREDERKTAKTLNDRIGVMMETSENVDPSSVQGNLEAMMNDPDPLTAEAARVLSDVGFGTREIFDKDRASAILEEFHRLAEEDLLLNRTSPGDKMQRAIDIVNRATSTPLQEERILPASAALAEDPETAKKQQEIAEAYAVLNGEKPTIDELNEILDRNGIPRVEE